MFEIPTNEQHDDRDGDDSTYFEYKPKTALGRRYDTIKAIYGNVNFITLYNYWFKDSILKQTIMLMDKAGLRKKGKVKSNEEIIKASSDEEIQNKLNIFKKAIRNEQS